jgi:hypothetical protein
MEKTNIPLGNTDMSLSNSANQSSANDNNILAGVKESLTRILLIDIHRIQSVANGCNQSHNSIESTAELISEEKLQDIIGQYDIEHIGRICERCQKIRNRVDYLYQAQNYITPIIFRVEVCEVVKDVPTDVLTLDENRLISCDNKLETLAKRYATWYINEYNRWHISDNESRLRDQLLNNDRLKVLRLAMERNHVAIAPRLRPWLQEIALLVSAHGEPSLSQVLANPIYDNFNPYRFNRMELPKLQKLSNQLNEIYEFANTEYHSLLNDQQLIANLSNLSEDEQRFFKEFDKHVLNLTEFPILRKVIEKLSKGINRKTIFGSDHMLNTFTRPMSPCEVKQAFSQLIDRVAPADNGTTHIVIKAYV